MLLSRVIFNRKGAGRCPAPSVVEVLFPGGRTTASEDPEKFQEEVDDVQEDGSGAVDGIVERVVEAQSPIPVVDDV